MYICRKKKQMRNTAVSTAIQTQFYFDNKIRTDFEIKQEVFLNKLRTSKGKNAYKRYLGSPLRYAGGKSLAVGLIVELLPTNLNRIISPFMGGGSFEIACAKELGLSVEAFDIFDILVNYWQVQISSPIELAKRLQNFEPTKEGFKIVKDRLSLHWKDELTIDDKIDLAAHYYYNHNTSYGPGFLSWPSSVYMQVRRYNSMIDKVKKTILNNINVRCISFENVFLLYPNDFFYCDPPYYLEGDSKMFKGIYPQRNFPIHHNKFQHELLRDLLHNHKGTFVLSYNDCSTIRKWYRDFEIIDVAWQYTMGQGETRIGLNRINEGINHVKQSHEILIIKR